MAKSTLPLKLAQKLPSWDDYIVLGMSANSLSLPICSLEFAKFLQTLYGKSDNERFKTKPQVTIEIIDYATFQLKTLTSSERHM